MGVLEKKVEHIELTVNGLRQDVATLRLDMTELKTELKSEISGLRKDVFSLFQSLKNPADVNQHEGLNMILFNHKELASKEVPLQADVKMSQI